MKKHEEAHYLFANIKEHIYPWIKESLVDHQALNGKFISEKDTPLISFVGELMILFVIARGEDRYEIIKDNMLPEDCNMEELYHTACENLSRDVKFVISRTLYGGFGIIADGYHEASALCFKHIWNMCAEKLDDDIAIMVPAKDMVLFVPASNQEQVEQMTAYGMEAYERNQDKISTAIFLFSKEKNELSVYEAKK
ncbi:MAG: DUF1444 family protein [Lachnospiraceae bacterium]